ncbi:formamidopyrimidine-DNA glycosylase [Tersicoccus solisilvae]|uniref:DNA-(apurinic or apyrimidinic site) lyase n=1 Tax=Tersicoccus solisilvae TaxID=1882339 RepID=A0ABQ1NXZ4_9MICC|nr:Fpg/Nei family DNA glycosylase [Tersicoccus solisilvae]GGC85227.1 formamidopyrimidine-DNA glycosylase [Tersicoccus solisilvae]
MPEGHSIHRLARQLTDVFGGQRVRVSSPQGRFAAGAALLDGHVLTRAEAVGKQLLVSFDGADLRAGADGADGHRVLRIHLGLYGAFSFGGDASFVGASSIGAPRRMGESENGQDAGDDAEYTGPPAPVGAVRVRLVSDHGWADLRGPTACEVITAGDVAALREAAGPDPLRADGGHDDAAEFARLLRRRGVACGQLLMDQAVVSGIGNVYRAELLFRAGIDPYRPGRKIAEREATDLWADAVFLMHDGVRLGRIVTTQRDPHHPVAREDVTLDADAADIPDEATRFVYKHTGEPCPHCGTAIATAVMAGRNLYWCPGCQH